jgi:hypothetical protein
LRSSQRGFKKEGMRSVAALILVGLLGCETSVVIGQPTDAGRPQGGGTGGNLGPQDAGLALDAGLVSVDAGASDAGLVSEGATCPAPLTCGDVTGEGDFACVDLATEDDVPTGAPACDLILDCPRVDQTCWRQAGRRTGQCVLGCIPSRDGGFALRPLGSRDGGPAREPFFVGGSGPDYLSQGNRLAVALPEPRQVNDLLLAVVGVAEGTGVRSVATPQGWTLLGGWPIHAMDSRRAPVSEQHGMWLMWHFAAPGDPLGVVFEMDQAAPARAAIVAYRGVSLRQPIHDKTGGSLYWSGRISGVGGGTTTLDWGREVDFMVTALTGSATYTVVHPGWGMNERLNSNESPNGLNVIIGDQLIYPRHFTGPDVTHHSSPSNSSADLLYSIGVVVLTPE